MARIIPAPSFPAKPSGAELADPEQSNAVAGLKFHAPSMRIQIMVPSTPSQTPTVSRPRLVMFRYSSATMTTPHRRPISREGPTETPSVCSSPPASFHLSHSHVQVYASFHCPND